VEPLELSFTTDVRAARWICLGCLVVGLVALAWLTTGDPTAGGNGTAGLVAAWTGVGLFGGFGLLGLWGLRGAGRASLRIDSTGIASTTGRGTVMISWAELAAVDLWVRVRSAIRTGVVDPKGLRTTIRIRVRLAPVADDFGGRGDLRPLLPLVGAAPFTRAIGVPPPLLGTGDDLDEVDRLARALHHFGGGRFRGVTRP
jgi:hypothetical protein